MTGEVESATKEGEKGERNKIRKKIRIKDNSMNAMLKTCANARLSDSNSFFSSVEPRREQVSPIFELLMGRRVTTRLCVPFDDLAVAVTQKRTDSSSIRCFFPKAGSRSDTYLSSGRPENSISNEAECHLQRAVQRIVDLQIKS